MILNNIHEVDTSIIHHSLFNIHLLLAALNNNLSHYQRRDILYLVSCISYLDPPSHAQLSKLWDIGAEEFKLPPPCAVAGVIGRAQLP